MSEDLTKKLPKSDSEKLNAILTTVGVMDTRLTALEQKLTGVEHKLTGVEHKLTGVEQRLTGLEKKVDERLHDTRPIWHRVIADIGQLQVGQQRLEEGLLKLESTVRDVGRDQIVINDSLRRIQLDLHTFDERLHRCERNQRPPNSST
jgi:chromosome segregation ATPase